MIIGVLNQKGGVGKTTLTLNLSAALALKGLRVLTIDSDPQESALDWDNQRTADSLFTVIGKPTASLHKSIKDLAKDYDHVLIDGPPRVDDIARSVILASDIIVIPVTPSSYDVWAAEETVDLVKEALIYKENLKALFVINRKIANTAIAKAVKKALEDYEIPILKASVGQRVVFAETTDSGLTVLEAEPEGKASKEIKALAKEIIA